MVLAQIGTIVVLVFGFITNNKRLDDMNTRLDGIQGELVEIRKILKEHGERITRLEEKEA